MSSDPPIENPEHAMWQEIDRNLWDAAEKFGEAHLRLEECDSQDEAEEDEVIQQHVSTYLRLKDVCVDIAKLIRNKRKEQ